MALSRRPSTVIGSGGVGGVAATLCQHKRCRANGTNWARAVMLSVLLGLLSGWYSEKKIYLCESCGVLAVQTGAVVWQRVATEHQYRLYLCACVRPGP